MKLRNTIMALLLVPFLSGCFTMGYVSKTKKDIVRERVFKSSDPKAIAAFEAGTYEGPLKNVTTGEALGKDKAKSAGVILLDTAVVAAGAWAVNEFSGDDDGGKKSGGNSGIATGTNVEGSSGTTVNNVTVTGSGNITNVGTVPENPLDGQDTFVQP